MNCGILSLGADIRGIDLRQRKVPQGSPLLLQQRIDASTNNQQIDDHGHPPLMGGQCLVSYYPMYKNGVLNYVDIKT